MHSDVTSAFTDVRLVSLRGGIYVTKVPLERALKKAAEKRRGGHWSHQYFIYFDRFFLNMRSIFSLRASMAIEFDCVEAMA